MVAAGALAAIATFHHQFWPSAPSPPQPIEATRKAIIGPAGAGNARVCRLVEVRSYRPGDAPGGAVALTSDAKERSPQLAIAADPAVPATLPSHAEPVDVCARYGGHRVNFMRGHHSMWRCDYPRHR